MRSAAALLTALAIAHAAPAAPVSPASPGALATSTTPALSTNARLAAMHRHPLACRKPIDDVSRVTFKGETVNARTLAMLETAQSIYAGPGDLLRIVQGSYTDAVAGSFGTHAGGGAVDISIRDPRQPSMRLFDEVEAMILALRLAGFAAWYRAPDEVFAGSVPHIHAIAIGDPGLSAAARRQVDGREGYLRGFDGLPTEAGVAPDVDAHGGVVACPWMNRAVGIAIPARTAGVRPPVRPE